jgi:hypothetical protein
VLQVGQGIVYGHGTAQKDQPGRVCHLRQLRPRAIEIDIFERQATLFQSRSDEADSFERHMPESHDAHEIQASENIKAADKHG